MRAAIPQGRVRRPKPRRGEVGEGNPPPPFMVSALLFCFCKPARVRHQIVVGDLDLALVVPKLHCLDVATGTRASLGNNREATARCGQRAALAHVPSVAHRYLRAATSSSL